jgi:hypothetical protein
MKHLIVTDQSYRLRTRESFYTLRVHLTVVNYILNGSVSLTDLVIAQLSAVN